MVLKESFNTKWTLEQLVDDEMNIYEFTNRISWENLWFLMKGTQQQLDINNLNTCKAM